MSKSRFIRYFYISTSLTIVFSIVSVLLISNITPLTVFYCILISAMYCFGFSMGSALLSDILDNKFDWIKETKKRVAIGTISNIIYLSLIIILIDIFIIEIIEKGNLSDLLLPYRIWKNVLMFIIAVGISTFYHAKSFMIEWKSSIMRQKELEKENIASQYEALKSQTDPHFFFNSLNILSSLIDEDPKLSKKFIKELANIYRYILEQRNNEICIINDELNFIEKYIFLQKIRFENGIVLNVNVDTETRKNKTISLALQIIFENIFKHNQISENKPININISVENEYLIIENNINRKRKNVISNKFGIENIKDRYKFFSDKEVIIEHLFDSFIVKLPILSNK